MSNPEPREGPQTPSSSVIPKRVTKVSDASIQSKCLNELLKTHTGCITIRELLSKPTFPEITPAALRKALAKGKQTLIVLEDDSDTLSFSWTVHTGHLTPHVLTSVCLILCSSWRNQRQVLSATSKLTFQNYCLSDKPAWNIILGREEFDHRSGGTDVVAKGAALDGLVGDGALLEILHMFGVSDGGKELFRDMGFGGSDLPEVFSNVLANRALQRRGPLPPANGVEENTNHDPSKVADAGMQSICQRILTHLVRTDTGRISVSDLRQKKGLKSLDLAQIPAIAESLTPPFFRLDQSHEGHETVHLTWPVKSVRGLLNPRVLAGFASFVLEHAHHHVVVRSFVTALKHTSFKGIPLNNSVLWNSVVCGRGEFKVTGNAVFLSEEGRRAAKEFLRSGQIRWFEVVKGGLHTYKRIRVDWASVRSTHVQADSLQPSDQPGSSSDAETPPITLEDPPLPYRSTPSPPITDPIPVVAHPPTTTSQLPDWVVQMVEENKQLKAQVSELQEVLCALQLQLSQLQTSSPHPATSSADTNPPPVIDSPPTESSPASVQSPAETPSIDPATSTPATTSTTTTTATATTTVNTATDQPKTPAKQQKKTKKEKAKEKSEQAKRDRSVDRHQFVPPRGTHASFSFSNPASILSTLTNASVTPAYVRRATEAFAKLGAALVQSQGNNTRTRVLPFGSAVSGLMGRESDIDVTVVREDMRADSTYQRCVGHLQRTGGIHVTKVVQGATVPVFSCSVNGVCFDVTINGTDAVVNSYWVAACLRAHPTNRPLLLAVKFWAKELGICDASRRLLSSYAYTLLVLHFLRYKVGQTLPDPSNFDRIDGARTNSQSDTYTSRMDRYTSWPAGIKDPIPWWANEPLAVEGVQTLFAEFLRYVVSLRSVVGRSALVFSSSNGFAGREVLAELEEEQPGLVQQRGKNKWGQAGMVVVDPIVPYNVTRSSLPAAVNVVFDAAAYTLQRLGASP